MFGKLILWKTKYDEIKKDEDILVIVTKEAFVLQTAVFEIFNNFNFKKLIYFLWYYQDSKKTFLLWVWVQLVIFNDFSCKSPCLGR